MDCQTAWDDLQLATSARIAAEILSNAAMTAYYDAMEAEYQACLDWWDCDNSGGGSSSSVVAGVPSRDEANTKLGLIRLDKARLVAERAELMQQLRKAAN